MEQIQAILVPKWGMEMEEGTIQEWHVEEGAPINKGDELVDIETSKIVNTLEANFSGVLRRRVAQTGVTLPVGGLLGVCAESAVDDADIERFVQRYLSNLDSDETVKASPSARKLAKQHGIPFEGLTGTGPRGRISKADVERAISVAEKKPVTQATGDENQYQLTPLSSTRKAIARRLTEAKQSIPHFYLKISCCLDAWLLFSEQIKQQPGFKEQKLSLNDFIIKAAGVALRDVPEVNSQYGEQGIKIYQHSHIALAVATENGLVTPVIHDVAAKGLGTIASESRKLIEKAHQGELDMASVTGATFSISNLGMLGVEQFSAVINPPQAAILAVGAARQLPVVRDNQIRIATMLDVTLSCDHRAIDGADGARWLQAFKSYVEAPATLLM